jgi:hypothetical protein
LLNCRIGKELELILSFFFLCKFLNFNLSIDFGIDILSKNIQEVSFGCGVFSQDVELLLAQDIALVDFDVVGWCVVEEAHALSFIL